jgi:hypothetical protein
LQVLPGRFAKETRTQFANIIRRYLAGDHSLISEIQANAQSASPVAQMARDSLGIETDDDARCKRLRDEIDLDRLHMENQQKCMRFFLDTIEHIEPDWKRDSRLVTQTKDRLKNMAFGRQEIDDGRPEPTPIYIQDVARELGYHNLPHSLVCKIGKKAVEL